MWSQFVHVCIVNMYCALFNRIQLVFGSKFSLFLWTCTHSKNIRFDLNSYGTLKWLRYSLEKEWTLLFLKEKILKNSLNPQTWQNGMLIPVSKNNGWLIDWLLRFLWHSVSGNIIVKNNDQKKPIVVLDYSSFQMVSLKY